MSAKEERILADLDRFLADGLALRKWTENAEKLDGFSSFKLVHTLNRPDQSRGFFGEAPITGRTIPVMGVIDEVFYDRPKAPSRSDAEAAEWMRNQIREFVLRYFLRISDFRRPQIVPEPNGASLVEFLGPLSMRPRDEIEKDGMGFSQIYAKDASSGEIVKFPVDTQTEITDLREVVEKFEWLVLRLQIYQFKVSMQPMGSSSPQVLMPLKEESYLVLSPEFICDKTEPENGVLGEYGFGYAFVKNPERGPFAYGPGEFEAAYQTIHFKVLEDGCTFVKMVFTSDQPQKILNLNLDPVQWSFTIADLISFGQASRILAPFKNLLEQMPFRDFNLDPTVPALDWMNTLTGGQAAQQLAMSKDELYKGFLRRHSLQHYQTVLGSLRTWRQIPDWLDEGQLPLWVVKGWSS